MGERDFGGWFATEDLAVRFDDIGFGIDFDFRSRLVEDQVFFGDPAGVFNGDEALIEREVLFVSFVQECLADECDGCCVFGSTVGCELLPVKHGLGRWDRGVGVAHVCEGYEAAFQNEFGFGSEKGGFPDNEIGELTDLDGADLVRNAAGDCRIDSVFRHISEGSEIIGCRMELGFELSELHFHLVSGLPGTGDYFSDSTHCLAVARHD